MTKIVNGLILAGGKSSRMNRDKGSISYFSKPQREHLIEILKPFCHEVYVSCRKNQYSSVKNCIYDHFHLDSPLNGILSAFHFDPEAAWLTVPVDMPGINEEAVRLLLTNRNKKKLATCFYDSEGTRPEPLFTLWEVRSRPFLYDFFNSGGFSPRKFLEENDITILRLQNPKMLVNINTEDDLQKFLQQHQTLQQAKLANNNNAESR